MPVPVFLTHKQNLMKLARFLFLVFLCSSLVTRHSSLAADSTGKMQGFREKGGGGSDFTWFLHDNGDGTFSPQIYLGSSITLGGSITLGAGSAIVGKVGIDQSTPGTTNNVVISGLTDGSTAVGIRVANIQKDVSAVTIDTIATVWTPTSGKKFRLMGGTISASAAMNVLFEDNSAGGGNFVFRTPKLAADTPFSFVVLGGQGKLSATANNLLKATGSAAGNITGTLYGTEE
jgi:hypothetical protein